jgi:aminoglycoside/choline kinase family phosphotransferase
VPSPAERLQSYLGAQVRGGEIEPLTADASTREYFRIDRNGTSAIACVYPEPFDAAVASYRDVTELFLAAGLRVAELFDVDTKLGIVVQEDLGDRILRDRLQTASPDERGRLIDEAIALIARVQAATDLAFERRSLASRLRFDTEKLVWELNYFKEHYFGTYLKKPLSPAEDARLTGDFIELSAELAQRAAVLCHRDYHAANLMIDANDKLRIIDHQDARVGSASYDLVSLLLDRVTDGPGEDHLASKRLLLLEERQKLSLPELDELEFEHEFTLQTIQRCLKAAGTFSYQSAVRGKAHFIQFIAPMLNIAAAAAARLDRFHVIQGLVTRDDDQASNS